MQCSLLFISKTAPRRLLLYPTNRLTAPNASPIPPSPTHTSYALSIEYYGSGGGTRESLQDLKVIASFRPSEKVAVELNDYDLLHNTPVYGCIGLFSIPKSNDVYVGLITDATPVGDLGTTQQVYRIISVAFYPLRTPRYDNFYKGNPSQYEPYDAVEEVHPCAAIQRYLSKGNFCFSITKSASVGGTGKTPIGMNFDLFRTQQNLVEGSADPGDLDYAWNWIVLKNLASLARKSGPVVLDGVLVPIMHGYVGIKSLQIGPGKEDATVAIISRLSCKRAGTRFNARGIDDKGHVANFVETEARFYFRGQVFSYAQIRGSVPVFWEQAGMQLLNPKLQITRSSAATQPAFERHMSRLLRRYGYVHIVNLLSQKESSPEFVLTQALQEQITAIEQIDQVRVTNYDFHEKNRGRNYGGLASLHENLRMLSGERVSFSLVQASHTGELRPEDVVCRQDGVFRTNCLDCLDRTNVVQGIITWEVLRNYLMNLDPTLLTTEEVTQIRAGSVYGNGLDFELTDETGGTPPMAPNYGYSMPMTSLKSVFNRLWAQNGDTLSMLYAGTSALKSGFTRTGKRTLADRLNDGMKSMNRFRINNFQDQARQETIDILLGRASGVLRIELHDPVMEHVNFLMKKREAEFTSHRKHLVYVGTWNLNGFVPRPHDLHPWLGPNSLNSMQQQPDMYVIGIQEIVELTAGQIVNTDHERRKKIEEHMLRALGPEYVLLRSDQMVGTALMVFLRKDMVGDVKEVEFCSVKTGLNRMTGNKGGIAMRLNWFDSELCFVTAHLAAGQTQFEDRNRDYHTINEHTKFKTDRRIQDHRAVVWLGDFNYRLELTYHDAHDMISKNELGELLHYDQLKTQIKTGKAFVGYEEGDIPFPPTYKYDVGTNKYDSSEKMRVPSWTDRILYTGSAMKQLVYGRAEVTTSDHRPVYSLFEVDLTIVDKHKKKQTMESVYSKISPTSLPSPHIGSRRFVNPFKGAERLTLGDEDLKKLPPPSDDSQAWWDGWEPPGGTTVKHALQFPERSETDGSRSAILSTYNQAVGPNGSSSYRPSLPPRRSESVKQVTVDDLLSLPIDSSTTDGHMTQWQSLIPTNGESGRQIESGEDVESTDCLI